MSKHTAGPWSVDLGSDEDGWPVVIAAGKIVANVNPESFSAGVANLIEMPADANALLIAAAPDLLEALQEMVAGDAQEIEDAKRIGVPFPDEMLAAYHKARAAIARATGEQP